MSGRWRIALIILALTASSAFSARSEDAFEIRKVERLHLDDVYPGPDGERVVELYLRARTRYEILRRLSKETGGDFLRAESTIHLSTFFNEIYHRWMHVS